MTDQRELFRMVPVADRLVPRDWPEAPTDKGWSISPKVIAKFRAWRETDRGKAIYATVERKVLALALDPNMHRIEVNDVCADVRKLGVSVNNTLRSCIARQLCEDHPSLAPLIERRKGKAS